MKKIILILLFLSPFVSNAQDTGWIIENFHSDIYIKEDGKILVNELLKVDFFNLQKHGIFRDIPLLYEEANGDKTILKIKPINVLDGNGNSINYEINETKNKINFKIGDPQIFVTGKQIYYISYEVEGALRDLGEVDELFWNVTGNNWPVLIKSITSNIFLPKGISIKEFGCFEGLLSSKKKCLSSNSGFNEHTQTNLAFFNSSEGMTIGSGLSVFVTYDSGIIPANVLLLKPFYLTFEFFVFVLVILIAIILNIINWYKNGRDYMYTRNKLYENDRKEILKPIFHEEPITTMYDPPNNLRPGIIGTLIDEKFHSADFASTVIDLAVRGYIKIVEIENNFLENFLTGKDFELEKLKEPDDKLLNYEKMTIEKIFSKNQKIKLSKISKNFFQHFMTISNSAEKEAADQGLFVKDVNLSIKYSMSSKVGLYWILSILLFLFLSKILNSSICTSIFAGLLVSFVITMIILSITAPQKTAKGRELYIECLGYRNFIKSVDKHRAKFYEDNNMFVNTLPYAIMFGMTDKYLDAMKEMGIDMSSINNFSNISSSNFSNFAGSLSNTTHSSRSSSGSGGGGFSGGGGGGGGGGSW